MAMSKSNTNEDNSGSDQGPLEPADLTMKISWQSLTKMLLMLFDGELTVAKSDTNGIIMVEIEESEDYDSLGRCWYDFSIGTAFGIHPNWYEKLQMIKFQRMDELSHKKLTLDEMAPDWAEGILERHEEGGSIINKFTSSRKEAGSDSNIVQPGYNFLRKQRDEKNFRAPSRFDA